MKRGEGDRSLTREGLDALLDSLDPDRELAARRYEEIRRRLIRFFEWRGCDRADTLTDDTFNRVAAKLADGLELHSDPYAYFCGVARLVALEYGRKTAKENRLLESDVWPPPTEPEDDADHRLDHLRHCLEALSPDQRQLALRYHQEEQRIAGRKRLCQELGIEMNALRIRVHRLRRMIETCIQARLED